MADLIQHGHMTPFGGQIIDGVSHDGMGFSSNSAIPSDSTTPSNSTITGHSDEIPCNSSSSSFVNNSDMRDTDLNSEIHDEIEIQNETVGKETETVKGEVDDMSDGSSSGSDGDTFVPGVNNDDLDYSTSDSYITDDDGSDIRGQGLRVRRYRDIISSESDDDMIHTNKIKRQRVKGKPLSRRRSCTVDDGDDQLYKMRLK